MIEEAEAETVTPELLRSLFRETHELIAKTAEAVRRGAAADAAARHMDVVRSQHTIIDQLEKLVAKVGGYDVRFDHLDRLEGRFDRLENKVDRVDAKVDRYDVRLEEIEDAQVEILDSQQQLLRQQSYADGRIDIVERRLGGEWADDPMSGYIRAEMTVARGQLRAVHGSVGTMAVRMEDRMNSLQADVRAIAVAVGARPAVAAKKGGG